MAFLDLRTEQVSTEILSKITDMERTSLVEILRKDPGKKVDVGEAEWFISHAWKYNFLELVEIVENFFKEEVRDGKGDPIVWFDLFCNSQYEAPKPYEWWKNEYQKHIGAIGQVLIIASEYTEADGHEIGNSIKSAASSSFNWKPYCFSRSWCVYEFAIAIQVNCRRIEIAISTEDQNRLDSVIREASVVPFFESLRRLLNFRTCQAFNELDLNRINRYITENIGFEKLEYIIYTRVMKVLLMKMGLYTSKTATELIPESEEGQALEYILELCFDEATNAVSSGKHLVPRSILGMEQVTTSRLVTAFKSGGGCFWA